MARWIVNLRAVGLVVIALAMGGCASVQPSGDHYVYTPETGRVYLDTASESDPARAPSSLRRKSTVTFPPPRRNPARISNIKGRDRGESG